MQQFCLKNAVGRTALQTSSRSRRPLASTTSRSFVHSPIWSLSFRRRLPTQLRTPRISPSMLRRTPLFRQTLFSKSKRCFTNSDSMSASATVRSARSHRRLLFRMVFLSSVALLSAASVFVYVCAEPSGKHWQRSLFFWSRLYPIYAHYRYVDFYTNLLKYTAEKRDTEFHILHSLYGDKIYDTIVQLKGFYIKLGQMGAARADMLPKEWVKRLRNLEDNCPFEDWSVIEQIMCEDYGVANAKEVFDFVDHSPFAAASIGQVHYGVLKGSGKEVAIKVMYPNVESLFRSDFAVARRFCEMAQPLHLQFLDETEKQFLSEFNYKLEARNLEEISGNLNEHPFWSGRVVVPKPHLELCTERCLVMDYLKGTKLVKALTQNLSEVASFRGQTMDELIEEQRRRKVQPTASELSWFRLQLKASDWLWNSLALVSNYTFGWLLGGELVHYRQTPVPLNSKYLLDLAVDVHGFTLLIDGAFNGDPHPGNMIVCSDGRLGLVDFGQVKRIALEKRLLLAKLICYLAEERDVETTETIRRMGLRTRDGDDWVALKQAQFFMNRDDMEFTGGRNVQMYLEFLDSVDPIEGIDEDFVMAARMRILLSGLGHNLGYELWFAPLWKHWSLKLLADNNVTH